MLAANGSEGNHVQSHATWRKATGALLAGLTCVGATVLAIADRPAPHPNRVVVTVSARTNPRNSANSARDSRRRAHISTYEAGRTPRAVATAALGPPVELSGIAWVAADQVLRSPEARRWFEHLAFAQWLAALPSPVAPVMACIRSAESGNYSESSHPGGASGAYQYEPDTWRTWFARWAAATGYVGPRYAYAYQAPPAVQDAVTEFTLTHGGAGNWSPRWGPDYCTVGIGG